MEFSGVCDAECCGIEDPENNKNCYFGRCTLSPSLDPTNDPTFQPTLNPSISPTDPPTKKPTPSPTYEICHCALIHAPVCCEGRTYDNACLAECHLHVDDATKECVTGQCSNACPTDYNPICCQDKYGTKTTYDNPCLAEEQGDIKEPAEEQDECEMGKCVDCVCTTEYDPYCCYDEEYGNKCEAECGGIVDPDKECEKRSCDESSGSCTNEYDPICCNKVSFNSP